MTYKDDNCAIDIDKVLRSKLGNKASWVPRFLVNWLKRTIHQEWMNEHLCGKGSGQTGVDWLDGCLEYLNCKVKVRTKIDGDVHEGLDAIPGNDDGRY